MLNILPALITCIIWSLSIVLYKKISRRIPVLKVNIVRLLSASTVLALLCVILNYTTINRGVLYAALSGIFALAIGDTAYIYSSTLVGVSVAAPIAYLYVILVQFIAILYGEELTINKIIASIIAIISILLITLEKSNDVNSRARILGILLAFLTCIFWSFGQVIIKPATKLINPLEITFIRALAGFTTLTILYKPIKKIMIENVYKYSKDVDILNYITLALIGILDLALGSYLFVLSIATIGVGPTVIVTGSIPSLSQIFATFVEKEKSKIKYIIAGILTGLSIAIVSI